MGDGFTCGDGPIRFGEVVREMWFARLAKLPLGARGVYLVLHAFLKPCFEFLLSLPEASSQLRDLASAKENYEHRNDDQYFVA